MTPFVEKLQAVQTANDSWVCVGLDPDLTRLPAPMLKHDDPFLPFLQAIVDATADLVCAYKPNLGFFLAQGAAGVIALERIIAYIPEHIPVILDGKFNDIGNTARAYARGAFEALRVDAVTLNPYLGQDGVSAFLTYPDKAGFVLARTSNQTARDFQDLRLTEPSHPPSSGHLEREDSALFHFVTRRAAEWNEHYRGTCGLVVGATYPQELAQVRAMAPGLPFLIPGIGAQGGDLKAATEHGQTENGTGPLINSSRGILYASTGDDYADAARRAASQLRQRINHSRS